MCGSRRQQRRPDPQGVQLIGARFREDLLLGAAQAVEDRAPVLTVIEPRMAVRDRTGRLGGAGTTSLDNAGSANSGSESKTRQLAEKLTTLRDLYNRKLITQEVYDREMQKAVQDSR